jgi:hypothetical protein
MNTTDALAVLTDALKRCRTEDVRTPQVFAALEFLAARAAVTWPFEQFHRALENHRFLDWEIEGRWQTLNASLNGIRNAVVGKR